MERQCHVPVSQRTNASGCSKCTQPASASQPYQDDRPSPVPSPLVHLLSCIAYAAPNPVAANAFGGFVLLILILLSGFSIVRGGARPALLCDDWLTSPPRCVPPPPLTIGAPSPPLAYGDACFLVDAPFQTRLHP